MEYSVSTLKTNTIQAATGTSVNVASGHIIHQPGMVLQVLQATQEGGPSTTSNSLVATGLFKAITPKFATSKILVHFSHATHHNTAGHFLVTNIIRNPSSSTNAGTTVSGGTALSSQNYGLAQTYAQGTATTNLQQGLAKVWINDETLQANSGAVDDSFNIGSTTDNSTGNCTITFSSPFSNDGFSAPYSNSNFGDGIVMGKHSSTTTSDVVLTYRTVGPAYTDAAFSGSLHGDLA